MADPAVVRPPFGAEVDGRRLLGEAVGFGRALRAARLSIDLGASVDFARALTLVDIGDREQVRAAGAAIFVRRRDDRATYDAVFDRWWRRRGSRLPSGFEPPPHRRPGGRGRPAARVRRPRRPATAARRPSSGPTRPACRCPPPTTRMPRTTHRSPASSISPDAYSQGEVLRHREFDRMTPAELREAERLVDALVPRLERRRTRRYELHSHGRRLAPRAMFRRNLGTGGQLVDWVWRRPHPRAALAGGAVRHLRLDGAPLAPAAPVRPGAVRGVGGPNGERSSSGRGSPGSRGCSRTATATAHSPACPTRSTTGPAGRASANRSATFNQHWARRTLRTRGRRHRRLATAGTAATRRSWRPRRRACGATATGWSGSTRWPARPATSRWPAGCARPSRTSTTSCRPAPSRTSSAWARSSAGSGPVTRDEAARRRRTRPCPARRYRP